MIYLPYIDVQERFTVIANKDVTIRRSFEGDLLNFSAPIVPDNLSILLPTLANETPPIDLPQTMRDAHFRIYPARGMIIDYRPGGLFQIGMSSSPVVRNFTGAGQEVRAIEGGFRAHFYAEFPRLSTPVFGRLEGNQIASVVEIDERGQLIAEKRDVSGFIEAWLVDIVEN